jgi:hypothetical protein
MLAISPLLLDAAQELSLATVASPGLYGPGSRTRLSMFDDTKSSSAK